ncbi:MAG: restriction endonuclease subunit S [Candidatus Saccharibacteria bacterium]
MIQTVLLGDLVNVVKGISYKSSDYCEINEGEAFINLKCVERGGGFRFDGIKYYRGKRKSDQTVVPGDILVANTDLTQDRDIIGSPIIMPDIGRAACFSLDISKLDIISDNLDKDYLFYYLKSPEARNYMIAHSNGSTVIHLSVKNIPMMPILLPDITIQRQIGSILRTIDEKIELNRQMNETLEQMGQALFRHYFIDNPEAEKWGKKPLDEVAEFLNGLAMQKYPKIDGKPTLPVIKIREMTSGITPNTDIANADIPDKYVIDNGDLLFSWSGTLIVKFWTEGKGALNQHLFKVTSDKYPEWLYYYWLRHHLDGFIETAKSKATTMGHIQRRHLHEAIILVPEATNLEKLTAIFEPILKQQVENMLEIQTLTNLRDTLLPRLISGKVNL